MDKSKLIKIGLIIIIFFIMATMAVYFYPGVLTCIPGCERFYPVEPDASYTVGQIISDDEGYSLFVILQGDYFVNERLDLIRNYSVNRSYSIGEVRAAKYIDTDPQISYGLFNPRYYKVLPAVEYIIGDRQDEGINMYVFVDPGRERVAYIGYIIRPGLASGNYTYMTDANGTIISETNHTVNVIVETLINVTIVDTGFSPLTGFTAEQKEAFVVIALNDSRVKHYIDGFGVVTNDRVGYVTELYGSYWWKADTPRNYIIYYPTVDFLTQDSGGRWAPFIQADIDPRYGTVVEFHAPSGLVKYR